MTTENNVNEVAENTQTSEVVESKISASGNYEITKTADGKYQRKAIYKMFSSITPVSREEKIAMMNLLDSDKVAQPLGEHIGKQIVVSDVIFNPYDKINEDTGEIEYGVLTYLITPEGTAYVTSSKSVYHSVLNMFKVFGKPHYSEEEQVTVVATKQQGRQFKFTDIEIVG